MAKDDLDALFAQLDDPSDIAWNEETYDLARARSLDATERDAYVARLVKHIDEGDTRAMLTLAELNATQAIDPLLRISAAQGPVSAMARRALVQLGRGQDVVGDVANDAMRGASRTVRAAAVINLGRIGGATALGALDACLEDSDAIVRQLACDNLVQAFGLHKYTLNQSGERELRTPLERMKLLLGSDLSALVKIGADELRGAIQKLQSGQTPEQAGLGWSETMPAALRAAIAPALVDDTVPLPVDELAKVTGPDRKWAEALIAIALQRQDPRAPEALAKLGATWTLPALDAATATADSGSQFYRMADNARRALKRAPN
jgi:hypothetical protein